MVATTSFSFHTPSLSCDCLVCQFVNYDVSPQALTHTIHLVHRSVTQSTILSVAFHTLCDPPYSVCLSFSGTCTSCGYISSNPVCKACVLLEGLNKGLPRSVSPADPQPSAIIHRPIVTVMLVKIPAHQ